MTTAVILVGGVPGAGKTTALRRLAAEDGARVLDPELLRDWFAARWPELPYRRYRWLVHTVQTVRVLVALLLGPAGQNGPLFVHDPATRSRRRVWFARLARARGWAPSLVFVDVGRAQARAGQIRRGRVVAGDCFDRHWKRWEAARVELAAGALQDRDAWDHLVVVERDEILPVLRSWIAIPHLLAA